MCESIKFCRSLLAIWIGFISFIFWISPMEDISTKYTVIKLEDPDHQAKLLKYFEQYKDLKKTSFCRYYLRGLCIMKSEHCKFAHDFDQLRLEDSEYKQLSLMECAITLKQERKRMFIDKTDFHQRPLFFIKKLDYTWLYLYQFTQRYKTSKIAAVSIQEINKNEAIRHRIRQILHREQWDKTIAFLEKTFPQADYTIDMFSNWFARLGFQKAQTYCKFGDFIRYLIYVKGYTEVNIIVPPSTSRSIYYIKNKCTYMYQVLDALVEDSNRQREMVKKLKEERLKKMPQSLQKKFICRFYMAGNCEKTREECFYVHNIEDIRYEKDQQFLKNYRQPPKSKEDRMNYISLYHYYYANKRPEDPSLTIDDVNGKFGYKDEIRKKVHLELYQAFLKKISQIYQMEILPIQFVKQQYHKFGFNHTDQSKFGQLENLYWDLGYYPIDILDNLKEKVHYIAKIPSIQEMDKLFYQKINSILKHELEDYQQTEDKSQILESSLRRLVYSHTQMNGKDVPLHVYLRKKQMTFKAVLQTMFPQFCSQIFFESSQQNFKMLMDHVKKFMKKKKKHIYTMDEIDEFVRGLSKEQINLNNLVNKKALLELGLLEIGKQIYFWPFANASLVIDRSHIQNQHKNIKLLEWKSIPLANDQISIFQNLYEEKVLVVDSPRTFQFCQMVLKSCFKYGIDLEGRLCQNGYIDFIQVSCINEKKFIFILDIFKMKRDNTQLYERVRLLVKQLFEDETRLKIMHACQQDIIALSSCMGVSVKTLFDTSGTEMYLQQRQIYRQMYQNNITLEHTIKKIHNIKTPGLNQVLDKWDAPNGPNQYKEQMKKIFVQAGREYFETRPIMQQFLLYSARDVEDLIEVQEKMLQQDHQAMWVEIGNLYANFKSDL